MKNFIYKIVPFFLITIFIFYWISIFILTMPAGYANDIIAKAAPRYKTVFGNSWKFFSPPFTYNSRLYYVIRDIDHPANADTIEVLENIILLKQQKAPFNQMENIIDHLLHHQVYRIINNVWLNKKKPSEKEPSTTDSAYIAVAVATATGNITFLNNKAALLNYANMLAKKRKIDTAGKEIRIIITQQPMRPFKYLSDTSLIQKEIICVETLFNRF